MTVYSLEFLKDLGFLNRDGAPVSRYYEFLDRSRSRQVVAVGVREAFSDLFAINVKANELDVGEVKNKLRTLFAGKKTDVVIDRIAKTFKALCEYGDFSSAATAAPTSQTVEDANSSIQEPPPQEKHPLPHAKIAVTGLQYHINIVLPESRDQAVYDALFRSLREHLG